MAQSINLNTDCLQLKTKDVRGTESVTGAQSTRVRWLCRLKSLSSPLREDFLQTESSPLFLVQQGRPPPTHGGFPYAWVRLLREGNFSLVSRASRALACVFSEWSTKTNPMPEGHILGWQVLRLYTGSTVLFLFWVYDFNSYTANELEKLRMTGQWYQQVFLVFSIITHGIMDSFKQQCLKILLNWPWNN